MDLLYSDRSFRRYLKQKFTEKSTMDDAFELSDMVPRLFEILHTMKQNSNEAQVECCMNDLAEILDDINTLDMNALQSESAHLTTLETMGLYIMNGNIQRNGCYVLSRLMEESESFRSELIKYQVHQFLVKVMLNYSQDCCIHAVGCRMITMLVGYPGIKEDVLHAQLVQLVVQAMESFEDDEEFQLPALELLTALLDDNPDAQEEFVAQGCHLLVLNILKSHSYSGEILEHGFVLLTSLLQSSDAAIQLIHGGLVSVAMETMKDHLNLVDLQSAACALLIALARHNAGQEAIVKLGLCEVMRSMLHKHRGRAKVQVRGLEALGLLMPMMITCQDKSMCLVNGSIQEESLQNDHWMKDILVTMATHGDDPDVLCMACYALSTLIDGYPGQCILIGEEEGQVQIHSAIMASLVLHLDNGKLCQWACQVLAAITMHSENVQKALVHKGIYLYIIPAMRKHKKVTGVQKWGCQVLRSLCINDVDCKMLLIKEGALSRITKALFRYESDAGVQEASIALLACLATDIELVRHQCAAEHVHLHVLKGMTTGKFLDDTSLVEVSLELLGVLAAAEEIPELLSMADALPIILNLMDTHAYHATIQTKGFVLLQILARYLDGPVCESAVIAILQAMCEFPCDEAVQEEGCVALHVISVIEPENSAVLVNQCAHERLFAILEMFSSKRRLIELASECLWFLGCQRNLKARMLLSACAGGLLKGAKCLIQIGADVNAGEGTNTPLCAACKNNRDDMVQFLLAQGITDVQTALTLCLEMEHHNLVGILLQKVGHDHDAGVIAWGGLKLGALCPEWLSPALTGKKYSTPSIPLDNLSWSEYLWEAEHEWQQRVKISIDLTSVTSLSESRSRNSMHEDELVHTEDNLDGLVAEQADVFEEGILSKTSPLRFDSLSGAALPYSRYDPRVVTPFSQRDSVILPRTASRSYDDSNEFSTPPKRHGLRRKSKSMANLSEFAQSYALNESSADVGFLESPEASPTLPPVEVRRRAVTGFGRRSPQPSGSFTMPDNTYIYSHDTQRCNRPRSVCGATPEDSHLMPNENQEKQASTFPMKRRRSSKACAKFKLKANPTVRVIDLSGNGIGDLEPIAYAGEYLLMHLANVERLDLSNNQLTYFPSGLHQAMPKLEHVNLSHNDFASFPYCLVRCKRLKSLNLSHNRLTCPSPPVKSVSASILLEHLSLTHNALKAFPEWLADFLPGLTELSVAGNEISALPSTPLKMQRLKTLDISHNQIESIPGEFLKYCFRLDTLSASHNALASLPDSAAPFLNNLKIVRMSHNNLTGKSPFYIPRFFLMLPNLKELDLSYNKLTQVPSPEAWTTKQLKELMFAHNKIKKVSLESGAGKWSNLERLVLGHNNLKSVPKGIGSLTSLTSLDLSHNPGICSLPDEMGKLSNLWDLQLAGLKLDLDESMQGKSKDLIAFLHSKLMNSVPYYRMKLVVVGLGGRGKTTLLNQLLKSKANAPQNELIIRDWVVRDSKATCKFCHHKSVIYTISTWDFKGREDLYHVFQCLMSSRTLYLVVYDVSRGVEEFENLRAWLLNIYACAPDAPVMLVGTHLDKVPKERLNEVLQAMKDKAQSLYSTGAGLPEIKAHVVLNCTQETPGIQALRNRIVHLIVKCKCKGHNLLGSRVPQAFVRLQQLVLDQASSKEAVPVLNRGDLRRIMLDDELYMCDSELSQAVKFLHEAGVLVHYDDPVAHLTDYFFIKPEWLCHVISSVVTVGNDKGLVTNGVLTREDLKTLVMEHKCAVKLPPELLSQFLRLLERFGVLLPLNHTEFLLPSRLSMRRPSITLPSPSTQNTCRRLYELAYIPLGFWARLIARLLLFTHTMLLDNSSMEAEVKDPCVQYWRDGVYVVWSEETYFLISQDASGVFGLNILSVLVPNSAHGFRLFGNLTDHVDALIEEWFPALLGTDPVQCLPLVSRLCPCLTCEDEYSHAFTLDECTEHARFDEYMTCPKTSISMPLQQLAPDVVLADLDRQWIVDSSKLALEEKKECVLGDGGYGTVYKAKYYDQWVAVKVFRGETDTCPHRLLRQEVPFLSRLRHPSIISMIGVSLRPRALVLELAPLGSLSSLLSKGEGLSRGLQHRIALQVAEGLAYLHHNMIVYRDLKPHNILIFSLSLGILINAKISDYGIARYATLYGLTASEGTPGYRAPEVARGDIAYNKEADMYSYGMFLYELVTGGRRPFEDLRFRSELDAAVVQGRMVEPITDSGCHPWPDVTDMIEHLLEPRPDMRPTAQEVFERLNTAELLCLKRDVAVFKGLTVECMTVRNYTENNESKMEVWIGSGLSEDNSGQVSWLNLTDRDADGCQGTVIRDRRVKCITAVHSNLVVMGTQSGKVWVFDAPTHSVMHSLPPLSDAVLCLRHYSYKKGNQDVLLVGLANGELAVYQTSSLTDPNAVPHIVHLCAPHEDEAKCQDCSSHPVACLTISRRRVYMGCGSDVIVMQLEEHGYKIERRWSIEDRLKGLVLNIAVGASHIWTSTKDSPQIACWDLSEAVHRGSIDCRAIMEDSGFTGDHHELRVMCMLLHNRAALWVGLGTGHVIVLSPKSRDPLCIINRHVSAVRCLVSARSSTLGRPVSLMMSGGMGFVERPGYQRKRVKPEFGYMLIWETDIGEQVKSLNGDRKKRQECLTLYGVTA